jgi:tripartite-type tricarboxylate transporter receptor subunit TctC
MTRWMLICVVALHAPAVLAQQYPAKSVRIVTGSAAGGGADITARQIGQRMTEAFGVQMIVDNRPGAAGMLANEFVSKAPADGYTLLVQPSSFTTVSPQLNARVPWDTVKQLAPVIQVSTYPLVLVVHPSVPARTVRELIAVAKKKPGALTFVSSGVGSNFHLAGELLKIDARIDMWHVPYKGSPAAVVDLIAGRGDLMFGLIPVLLPHIHVGRLRPLGVSGLRRNALLPDTPTVAESAIPGFEIDSWEGLFAPPGTPREIVSRIHSTLTAALGTQESRDLWASKGVEFVPLSSEQFAAKVRSDYDKSTRLIKIAGVKQE